MVELEHGTLLSPRARGSRGELPQRHTGHDYAGKGLRLAFEAGHATLDPDRPDIEVVGPQPGVQGTGKLTCVRRHGSQTLLTWRLPRRRYCHGPHTEHLARSAQDGACAAPWSSATPLPSSPVRA